MAILKVGDTKASNSYFIFGSNGTGRTNQAVKVAMDMEKVLYVGLANNGVAQYADVVPATWDVLMCYDYDTFKNELLTPLEKGNLDYDAIIIDDIEALIEYTFNPAVSDKLIRNEWGKVVGMITSAITIIKEYIDTRLGILAVTTSVYTDEATNKRRMSLNEGTARRLLPKFSNRWYTYAQQGKDTTAIEYCVQTQSLLADRFMPVK